MDNDEIIRIKQNADIPGEKNEEASGEHFRKYVVFFLNRRKYAVSAAFIREITISNDVFFLPFVPQYLCGLLNRHGEPHAVIDLGVIADGEKTEGSKFMIMDAEDDKIAFIVSDIQGISNISDELFNSLTGDEEKQNFFSGSVSYKGDDILIIEPERIIQQVRTALKTAGT